MQKDSNYFSSEQVDGKLMKKNSIFLPYLHIIGLVSILSSLTAAIVFAFPNQFNIQIESWAPYYFPKAATVRVGTIVQWENPTATAHTVTHDGCARGGSCLFDSGLILPSGLYQLTHLPPGIYSYHCTIHPVMRGVLAVANTQKTVET